MNPQETKIALREAWMDALNEVLAAHEALHAAEDRMEVARRAYEEADREWKAELTKGLK